MCYEQEFLTIDDNCSITYSSTFADKWKMVLCTATQKNMAVYSTQKLTQHFIGGGGGNPCICKGMFNFEVLEAVRKQLTILGACIAKEISTAV